MGTGLLEQRNVKKLQEVEQVACQVLNTPMMPFCGRDLQQRGLVRQISNCNCQAQNASMVLLSQDSVPA